VGNGPAGNVGREAIGHVVSNDDGVAGAVNPLPAQGGVGPEPAEEARVHAPHAFYVQERGVTPEDYVDIARRHPEVQEAAVVVRWTGSWHTVFILVHRRAGRPVDHDFADRFRKYMDRYRMSGYDLQVLPPQYAPLDIALTAFAEPGYFRTSVRQALVEVFSNSVLPNGQLGFFHSDNLTFGQPVYQSQVVARAAEVPGVMRVDVNRFTRWGGSAAGGSPAVEPEIPVGQFEVARLDNDPGAPWRGVIRFNVVGGW
jgi:predicted phage baseplate assembly protein